MMSLLRHRFEHKQVDQSGVPQGSKGLGLIQLQLKHNLQKPFLATNVNHLCSHNLFIFGQQFNHIPKLIISIFTGKLEDIITNTVLPTPYSFQSLK